MEFLEADLGDSLDLLQGSTVDAVVQKNIHSTFTRTSCPSGSVDERFHLARRFDLDHQLDVREIKSSSCNISGYNCGNGPFLEVFVDPFTVLLLYVPMKHGAPLA